MNIETNREALSKRGAQLLKSGTRADIELFFEAINNRYDPVTNPDGAFPLNVAENFIMGDRIRQKLHAILVNEEVPQWVLQYTSALGMPEVREVLAAFMQRHFSSEAIASGNIVFSAGAAASLEVLSFALANSGDVVVIPAPAYPMYTNDLGVKSGMERYDLQTHRQLEGSPSLALVTESLLEQTLSTLNEQGKRFRMLLLTTPDNPSGSTYSLKQLRSIAEWCMQKHIHLVVNEIYALSRINTEDPEIRDDYATSDGNASFATLMSEFQSSYLHLVYALSKDFCMSGMRFGIIHTLDEALIRAIDAINIPHMVSNLTQWVVGELFKDDVFLNRYIKENRTAITNSYKVVIQTLRTLEIPYIPAEGSLFVWADFSSFLDASSAEAEFALWTSIYQNTGVLFTPGTGFGHRQFGLFRIVHTSIPATHLEAAMEKVYRYLRDAS